jgi:hypothetical protein
VGEVPDQGSCRMGGCAIKSCKVATSATGAEEVEKGTCLEECNMIFNNTLT